jgi:hypothetical protein
MVFFELVIGYYVGIFITGELNPLKWLNFMSNIKIKKSITPQGGISMIFDNPRGNFIRVCLCNGVDINTINEQLLCAGYDGLDSNEKCKIIKLHGDVQQFRTTYFKG